MISQFLIESDKIKTDLSSLVNELCSPGVVYVHAEVRHTNTWFEAGVVHCVIVIISYSLTQLIVLSHCHVQD